MAQGAFAKCQHLKSVRFGDGLVELGTDERPDDGEMYFGVFQESAVERVELPYTLRRIEYCAFKSCKSLKDIGLPASVEHIGELCF